MSHIVGVFCISLDFEKYWGIHDVSPIAECQHLEKVEGVIDGILNLFKRYDTHATWAFIGLLGYDSIAELRSDENLKHIPYTTSNYSPFPLSIEKYGGFNDKILLGKSEIEAIKAVAFQELASHTFSHFYFLEEGIDSDDIQLDIDRMKVISQRYDLDLKSIIFPRNQVQNEALETLRIAGFRAYRGNQENPYWSNSQFEKESLIKKMLRVLDAYFPISKTKSYSVSQLKAFNGLVNIPANRFLRPASNKKWIERQKIKRIKREMHQAAKRGTIYHLWWHPHNFTHQPEIALNQLEEILAYYHVLRKRYKFVNLNMNEISNRVKA